MHKNPTRYPTCSLVTADPAIGEIERNILLDMNGLMVRSKTYKYGEKFQIYALSRALPKYISSQIARSSKRSTRSAFSNFSIVTLPVKR